MNPPDPPSTLHFFVDEAGDPTLFNAKGRILVGQEGCSKTFILGKLDVEDPAALHTAFETLRTDLLADPYFKRVPSMQAERGKTGRAFHAKDDAPEVRREVFKVLLRFDLRFYGVIRQKSALLDYVRLPTSAKPDTATAATICTTRWWRNCFAATTRDSVIARNRLVAAQPVKCCVPYGRDSSPLAEIVLLAMPANLN